MRDMKKSLKALLAGLVAATTIGVAASLPTDVTNGRSSGIRTEVLGASLSPAPNEVSSEALKLAVSLASAAVTG